MTFVITLMTSIFLQSMKKTEARLTSSGEKDRGTACFDIELRLEMSDVNFLV